MPYRTDDKETVNTRTDTAWQVIIEHRTSNKETIDNVRQGIVYNKETQLGKNRQLKIGCQEVIDNFRTGKQEIINNIGQKTIRQ